MLLCGCHHGKIDAVITTTPDVRGSVSINIFIISTITIFKLDVISLIVCVDQNPRSSLLNLVHVYAWDIEIFLC
jgi:hypothetical protein